MIPRIKVAGIPIDLFTVNSLHETVRNTILQGDKRIFLHANARLIELANSSEPWLKDFFDKAENYVMCDGAGIQLAARLTGQTVPKKIPYNIWLWDFFRFIVKNEFSIYFIGAGEPTIKMAVQIAKKFEPTLNIKGFSHGYFSKTINSPENVDIIARINASRPDILLVGFGMPIQERWIQENIDGINAKAVFSCGGAFEFISGMKPVAPLFFRKLYLEWLFRFFLEPVRLFERATISNIRFIGILLKNRTKKIYK